MRDCVTRRIDLGHGMSSLNQTAAAQFKQCTVGAGGQASPHQGMRLERGRRVGGVSGA